MAVDTELGRLRATRESERMVTKQNRSRVDRSPLTTRLRSLAARAAPPYSATGASDAVP